MSRNFLFFLGVSKTFGESSTNATHSLLNTVNLFPLNNLLYARVSCPPSSFEDEECERLYEREGQTENKTGADVAVSCWRVSVSFFLPFL